MPKAHDRYSLDEVERAVTRRCEQSLAVYIRESWPHIDPEGYVHGRHIELMAEYLEAFIAGEIPRLLINIPPGHMKSIACSVALNSWTWGPRNLPGKRFMGTAYGDHLALRDADRTRQLIRSEWYQERWGHRFQLRRGQDTKGRYENDQRGYRYSCAIDAIMGEGGDFVILDDPHNVQRAESDEVREETIRKIRLALPTRVRSKDGGVLVIMQRLHERDYAGHMIADSADLVHLCLPARFEANHPFVTKAFSIVKSRRELPGDYRTQDGELLWPELFDARRLKALSTQLSAYGAAGQLQQRPAPREGGMFQRKDFHILDKKPEGPHESVRGWDLGATEGGGKFTAGVKVSRYRSGMVLVEDVRRGQWSPYNVDVEMLAATKQDGHAIEQSVPQDPGQAGKSQIRHIGTNLEGYRVHYSTESGEKTTRAGPVSSQAEAGNLYLLRADWNDPYIDEMCTFPNGAYSDQVDGTSRAYARLVGKREQSVGGAPVVIALDADA